MLRDIKHEYRPLLQQQLKKMKELEKGVRIEGTDILDLLDYFDTRCLPSAIESLSRRSRNVYFGKRECLMRNSSKIKRRKYKFKRPKQIESIQQIVQDLEQFDILAFDGYESFSTEPIDKLIDAEYYSMVARSIQKQYSYQEEM